MFYINFVLIVLYVYPFIVKCIRIALDNAL